MRNEIWRISLTTMYFVFLLQVAIIVPYRNRFEQLKIFLRHMHPFLQRQQLSYQIFIIEQVSV